MRNKGYLFIIGVSLAVFYACRSGNSFTSRKYTPGIFREKSYTAFQAKKQVNVTNKKRLVSKVKNVEVNFLSQDRKTLNKGQCIERTMKKVTSMRKLPNIKSKLNRIRFTYFPNYLKHRLINNKSPILKQTTKNTKTAAIVFLILFFVLTILTIIMALIELNIGSSGYYLGVSGLLAIGGGFLALIFLSISLILFLLYVRLKNKEKPNAVKTSEESKNDRFNFIFFLTLIITVITLLTLFPSRFFLIFLALIPASILLYFLSKSVFNLVLKKTNTALK